MEEITLKDYLLTNIDLKTCSFTIRLKNNEEYIVYHKYGKYYIKKDGKEIPLSNDVKRLYLSEVRIYNHDGI